ncbi:heme A synthase [Pseudoalteromonas fenneropenaei]|uniref:Heme A synthase n=1 Tax=Pseudoalteromonas fenneropenaei TaxID=1737459 RepID=A0ABV7CQM7_9GAMM
MTRRFKYIALFASLLAALVVTLGAYTRLSHAGLGCPDWPGCYGFLTVPNEHHEISAAHDAFPGSQVEPKKAWIEMVHRYFAGSLGIVILVLAGLAVMTKASHTKPVKLSLTILVLVVFQALLGMWTVTLNLQPVIVMGHLLGGFAILSLLTLLYLRLKYASYSTLGDNAQQSRRWVLFALGILILQIALGGWLAANYAAPHCPGLPLCSNIELFSIESLFHLPASSATYEYGVLPFETRLSIHVVHRVWAVVTVCALGLVAWRVWRASSDAKIKQAAQWVLMLLLLQFTVGVAIVHWQFPLLLTLFHNFMAAMLLIATVRLSYFCSK